MTTASGDTAKGVEAMEAAGLVQRWPAEDDARGVCAALTSEGQRAYRRAEVPAIALSKFPGPVPSFQKAGAFTALQH